MALVTVTGNAWGHDRQPISPTLQPELWFRPLQSSIAAGLMTQREVKATLTTATGEFTVQLESAPGLLYVPVLRWLNDASQGNESMENRARQYDEWDPIVPGSGGDITGLSKYTGQYALLYGFGNPPSFLQNSIYLDISNAPVRIWGPPNSFVGS